MGNLSPHVGLGQTPARQLAQIRISGYGYSGLKSLTQKSAVCFSLLNQVCFLCLVLSAGDHPLFGQAGNSEARSLGSMNSHRHFDVEPDFESLGADFTTSNTTVTLTLIAGQIPPKSIAVFVSRGELKTPKNSSAKWIPYTDKVRVDLGEGDGKREIFVAARWNETDIGEYGSGFGVTVSRSKPTLFITHPPRTITFQQVIQLKGYSLTPLSKIEYDLFDQKGEKFASDKNGFVTDQHFDRVLFEATTNYFQCFDVELVPGTNTLVLRCADRAGNWTTTNLVYVFTTVGDTNPPVFIAVDWPKPGATLSGNSFIARGRVDDYTAQMAGQIVGGGRTNFINGFPERNGYFWYDVVPLSLGRNDLTLTATDAAGNRSITNVVVNGIDGPIITLDPITPAEKLWQPRVRATGKVSPARNSVWINGVQAEVKLDGTWTAENVPVISPNGGGVATFELASIPPEGMTNRTAKPNEMVSSQASLGTNAMVLNASSPACGVFQLHLDGTASRSFVLQASTNLIEWTPILTNSNPDATFDYTDSNTHKFPCRFFRVVPQP